MKTLVLHGYTMNAAAMREHLGELGPLLARETELVFMDAPHTCSEAAVARLSSFWKVAPSPPPHRAWWESSDDGREYRGWEETRERMTSAIAGAGGEVGLLGFSQGAILAAAIAALSESGEMPPVRFAVLVAGRTPRADVLRPLLTHPLRTPSLHVWGAADAMARDTAQELANHFEPTAREVTVWNGGHRVPTRGEGADAILRFVRRHRADLRPGRGGSTS